MKPDKHFLFAACIAGAAVCLIALTWIGTTRAIDAQRQENAARITAALGNQALTFSEQINRQILAVDQTLRSMVAAWESDPRHFDLEARRTDAVVLNGLSRDMVLTDENGIVRQSSVSEAINQNASGLGYFRALADPSNPGDTMYIGPATIDGIMRQWHMNMARALHYPDGSFAGVIDADYRIAAITDVFSQTTLGPGSFVALVGLDDGKLRGATGPATVNPDASIVDTPMFAAIREEASGVWTGPSASDAVVRIHAFRHLPGLDLTVVVAMSEVEAMRPANAWREQARTFAGCITGLLVGLALVLVQLTRLARRREALFAQDRAILAASNAQLEVARAMAAAKAEQLEATLSGMSDGVSMVDGHMCLVEWNARFPEIAGVPAEILRVGLPMEEILRAQIKTGEFGSMLDPEPEVERRMARLRVAPFGVVQRQRPDGRTMELRRNRLPDGGFVTLYADVTERKQAEEALRAARAAAETANLEKSRFVAIVSHEIRTPLNALLNTIRLLADSTLAPAQRSLLALAKQSGDVLSGLINDILAMSQLEAGTLAIRPSLFELRPLLDSSVEMFAEPAAERGITIHIEIAAGTPGTLLTDPGRLRQVQLNLLSNAVKYARPGDVWLTAEPGRRDPGRPDPGQREPGQRDPGQDAGEAVRLCVKDSGPVIASEARVRLFRPFTRLDRPEGDEAAGTGLGLSICQHLVSLMGGKIGCDAWMSPAGLEGNVFWVTLPAAALPFRTAPGQAGWPNSQSFTNDQVIADGFGQKSQSLADLMLAEPALARMADPAIVIDGVPPRTPPRTRILLVDDVVANQIVTATLLRREGHHVRIASSGPAAIEAVKTAPYDLVFMDIFMPGMSGQEATQIIRALPEPTRAVAIVAMTAHVGPDDEAIFRAAGIDGIITKPVSLAELLDVLWKYVWAAYPIVGTPVVSEKDRQMPDGNDTIAILSADRINELRTNLAPETFAELMEECLQDMDHRLPALRRAVTAGAPAAITAQAHAMVGMAAGYGMAAMEARLRTLMAAARGGDVTQLDPAAIIMLLESDFAEAAHALREILRSEVV